MVIKFRRVSNLNRRQLVLKGWSLASALFFLALALGMAIANWAAPTPTLSLGLATAAIWATSSFDPSPRFWLCLVWQYFTPWVIGLAGLVCFPMGLFLGVLSGSRWVGIVIGVGLGSLMSVALIASILTMSNLLLLTVYQTQIFRNRFTAFEANSVKKQQTAGRYRQRQSDLSYTMAISMWSFIWSILQGVAIAGTLVWGSLWVGATGLFIAIGWNVGMVITLIAFHYEFRQRLQQGQRFLLILATQGAGIILGALLLH